MWFHWYPRCGPGKKSNHPLRLQTLESFASPWRLFPCQHVDALWRDPPPATYCRQVSHQWWFLVYIIAHGDTIQWNSPIKTKHMFGLILAMATVLCSKDLSSKIVHLSFLYLCSTRNPMAKILLGVPVAGIPWLAEYINNCSNVVDDVERNTKDRKNGTRIWCNMYMNYKIYTHNNNRLYMLQIPDTTTYCRFQPNLPRV